MRSILTIARTVLKESLHGQLFYGLLIFLIFFLGFSVYISSLSLGEVGRVIANTGMAGISLLGLTCTILFGLYALYQERERRELYILLNRIPRSSYLLGRFFGTTAITGLFILLMAAGIFLLTRMIGMMTFPGIFFQAGMAILEYGMLLSIAMLFYTLGITFTLNAFMILAVYVAGHSFSEAIESFMAMGSMGSQLYLNLVKILSYVLPNFDMFDFRLSLIHGENIALGQSALAILYGCLYTSVIMLLAIERMNRSDI